MSSDCSLFVTLRLSLRWGGAIAFILTTRKWEEWLGMEEFEFGRLNEPQRLFFFCSELRSLHVLNRILSYEFLASSLAKSANQGVERCVQVAEIVMCCFTLNDFRAPSNFHRGRDVEFQPSRADLEGDFNHRAGLCCWFAASCLSNAFQFLTPVYI